MSEANLRLVAAELPKGGEGKPPPEWIHVVPFGTWHHHVVGRVTLGPKEGAEIVKNLADEGRRIPIDFEHASELATKTGKPAPATGWIDRAEVREDGVWAHVDEWLEPGKSWAGKEYLYVSPVVQLKWKHRRTGEDVGHRLASVALTNQPFFAGDLRPLTATELSQGVSMIPLLLLTALGLAEGATEEAAVAEVEKLKKKAGEAPSPEMAARAAFGEQVLGALSWKAPPPGAANKIAVAMGKAAAAGTVTPDVSAEELERLKMRCAELQGELLIAQNGRQADKIEALVARGKSEGRILPAQEKTIRDIAALSYDQAEKLVASLASITTTQVQAPGAGLPALTGVQADYCKKNGIDELSYQKQLARERVQ